jgi:hypothetical protein
VPQIIDQENRFKTILKALHNRYIIAISSNHMQILN